MNIYDSVLPLVNHLSADIYDGSDAERIRDRQTVRITSVTQVKALENFGHCHNFLLLLNLVVRDEQLRN